MTGRLRFGVRSRSWDRLEKEEKTFLTAKFSELIPNTRYRPVRVQRKFVFVIFVDFVSPENRTLLP